MDEIITLSRLLSKQKIKQINIITENGHFKGKAKSLYEGIRDKKINNESEAIKLLGYSSRKDPAFKKLKQRLLQRLINTLFFIDINQYGRSEYASNMHAVYKNWAACQLLIERLEKATAVQLAQKILRNALRMELLDIVLFSARYLYRHFSIYEFNDKKAKYYERLMNKSFGLIEDEAFAEKYFIELANLILKSKNIKRLELQKKYKPKIEILKEKILNNDFYYFNLFAHDAIYFYYYLLRENGSLLQITLSGINYFKGKRGFSPVAAFSYSIKLGVVYINTGEIKKAKSIFLNIDPIPTPGKVNWYNLMNYITVVHILEKEYQKAFKYFKQAIVHPGFAKLGDVFREPWLIKEAFIHFLIRMEKINPYVEKGPSLRPFRLGRFLNDMPHYSKDKKGLNITILIIQMLFLILDKKYNAAIDRIDALRQYSYRYLRQNESFRSNCFIKMLIKVPEYGYHPVAVKRHTEDLYIRLLTTSTNIDEQSNEIEVIPYENLWELVLELLEKRRRGDL